MASYKLKDNGTYMYYYQRNLNVTASDYSDTSTKKTSFFFYSPYTTLQTTTDSAIQTNKEQILLEQNSESV